MGLGNARSRGANGKESGPFLFAVGLVPHGAGVTCSDPVQSGTTK
jgi:hypothetical protein